MAISKKETVIQATDYIAEALRALTRCNFDNEAQARNNMEAARHRLSIATVLLEGHTK